MSASIALYPASQSMFSEQLKRLMERSSSMLDPTQIVKQSLPESWTTLGDRGQLLTASLLFSGKGFDQSEGGDWIDIDHSRAPSINRTSIRASGDEKSSFWASIATEFNEGTKWYFEAKGNVKQQRDTLEANYQKIVELCEKEFPCHSRLNYLRGKLSSSTSPQPVSTLTVKDQDLLSIDKGLFIASALKALRQELQDGCGIDWNPICPDLQADSYAEAKDQPAAMLPIVSGRVNTFLQGLQSDEMRRKKFAKRVADRWAHAVDFGELFESARNMASGNEAELSPDFHELAFDLVFDNEQMNCDLGESLRQHRVTAGRLLGQDAGLWRDGKNQPFTAKTQGQRRGERSKV